MMIELIGYFFAGVAATIMLSLFMLFIMAVRAAGELFKIAVYGVILVFMITTLGHSVFKALGGF
jgi:hypothetical protein